MKKIFVAAILAVLVSRLSTRAQTQQPPSGKTLAATMGVYVFPTSGQLSDEQSIDEAQCYQWAVQNTGTDPFQLTKQLEQQKSEADAAKQQTAQATQGSAVRGAAGGAATGALIGAIAGNAGKGAAIGAASGAVLNRGRTRAAQEQTTQQIEQKSGSQQKATAEQIEGFKKAFSVCLEAKKYMVKY